LTTKKLILFFFLLLFASGLAKAQEYGFASVTFETTEDTATGTWTEGDIEIPEDIGPATPTVKIPPVATSTPEIKTKTQVATQTPKGVKLEAKRIDISISEQRLRVIENYQIVHEFLVSTGKKPGSTPKGVMQVYNHALNPVSRAYGVHLYRWLAVTPSGSHGIHGLFAKGYEKKLGSPASHGCIRLSRPNAEIVYEWTVKHLKSTGKYPQVYIY